MFSKIPQNVKVVLGTGALVAFSAYTLQATNPSQKSGHGLFDSHKPEDVQVSIDKKRNEQIEASRKALTEQEIIPTTTPIPASPSPAPVTPVSAPTDQQSAVETVASQNTQPERPRSTQRLQQPNKGPLDPKAELFFRKAQIFKNMEEDFAWQEEQDRKRWKEAQEKKKNANN